MKHMVGASGVAPPGSSDSIWLGIIDGINHELGKMRKDVDPKLMESIEIGSVGAFATMLKQNKYPTENLQFMANRFLKHPRCNIILGSPLYVAKND
jgi:hypothetical protein